MAETLRRNPGQINQQEVSFSLNLPNPDINNGNGDLISSDQAAQWERILSTSNNNSNTQNIETARAKYERLYKQSVNTQIRSEHQFTHDAYQEHQTNDPLVNVIASYIMKSRPDVVSMLTYCAVIPPNKALRAALFDSLPIDLREELSAHLTNLDLSQNFCGYVLGKIKQLNSLNQPESPFIYYGSASKRPTQVS